MQGQLDLDAHDFETEEVPPAVHGVPQAEVEVYVVVARGQLVLELCIGLQVHRKHRCVCNISNILGIETKSHAATPLPRDSMLSLYVKILVLQKLVRGKRDIGL